MPPLLTEFLTGLGQLLGYYLLVAIGMLLLRNLITFPQELFRKILHTFCVLSVFVFLNGFQHWYLAAGAALLFAAVIYPALKLLEHLPAYKKLFSERKDGEVKTSLIIVQVMFAVLIAFFWGWLGADWKYVIPVSVLAWGLGDAAAALVGKKYGRHPIQHRLLDGKKTYEGTFAMFIVSGLIAFFLLLGYGVESGGICFLIALLTAVVCAAVELFSQGGMDTITVPFSAAASISLLVSVFHLFTL